VKSRVSEEATDAAGWRIARCQSENQCGTPRRAAAARRRGEVLAPAELRDKMAEIAQAMTARYQPELAQHGRRFEEGRFEPGRFNR
jgi:hypothetical protein